MAFTPVFTVHDTTAKVDQEIKNLENAVQNKEFTIKSSTPNLSDLRDGEFVIVSSGTFTKVMFRRNQEIYSINVSCITVTR